MCWVLGEAGHTNVLIQGKLELLKQDVSLIIVFLFSFS